MKNMTVAIFLMAAISVTAQNDNPDKEQVSLNDEADSLSYFLGLNLGYELQNLPFDADPELIMSGLSGALQGTAPYDPPTTMEIFRRLQMSLQQREQEKANLAAEEALAMGNKFLAINGKREEVRSTPSGLQYEVLTKGDGPMPADTSTVNVHYEGSLTDGTVFDSSYERGEPISIPLNRVIPGWTEGLQLMPVGSTYTFYIPPNLGYGARESGPIPGNSVLIFKIELLGIE